MSMYTKQMLYKDFIEMMGEPTEETKQRIKAALQKEKEEREAFLATIPPKHREEFRLFEAKIAAMSPVEKKAWDEKHATEAAARYKKQEDDDADSMLAAMKRAKTGLPPRKPGQA